MYAVLFETTVEKTFKVYTTLQDAQYDAANAVNESDCKATIFDYDAENKTYIEFYTVH